MGKIIRRLKKEIGKSNLRKDISKKFEGEESESIYNKWPWTEKSIKIKVINRLDNSIKTITHHLDGLRHGDWFYLSSEEVLLGAGRFKRGKPIGVWRWYDLKGDLKREVDYDEKIIDGIYKEYSLTGKLIKEVIYNKGHEELHTFYFEDGKIKAKGYFTNLRKSLFDDENIPTDMEMKIGNWIYYSKNGDKICEGQWDENKLKKGLAAEYHDNGHVKRIHDKTYATQNIYNENGQLYEVIRPGNSNDEWVSFLNFQHFYGEWDDDENFGLLKIKEEYDKNGNIKNKIKYFQDISDTIFEEIITIGDQKNQLNISVLKYNYESKHFGENQILIYCGSGGGTNFIPNGRWEIHQLEFSEGINDDFGDININVNSFLEQTFRYEGEFINGKMEGVWSVYDTEDDTLSKAIHFKNGKLLKD